MSNYVSTTRRPVTVSRQSRRSSRQLARSISRSIASSPRATSWSYIPTTELGHGGSDIFRVGSDGKIVDTGTSSSQFRRRPLPATTCFRRPPDQRASDVTTIQPPQQVERHRLLRVDVQRVSARRSRERYVGARVHAAQPGVADGKTAFIDYFERMARGVSGQARRVTPWIAEGDLSCCTASSSGPATTIGGHRHLPVRRRRQDRRALGRAAAIPANAANDNAMFQPAT